MHKTLNLLPGQTVDYQGKSFLITHLLDLDTVLAKSIDDETPTTIRLYVKDLRPASDQSANSNKEEITLISDDDWQEANRRFLIIQPLLNTKRSIEIVVEHANKTGVAKATIYRWVKAYQQTGRLTSLLPKKQSGGRGRSRLSTEIDTIIDATIQDYYLRSQKRSVQKTCDEVSLRCRNAGLAAPHPNTVRNRISQLSEQVQLERRAGRLKARDKYTPLLGQFPGADFPLSIVQIDHTKIDLIIVDDVQRQPVGRPWITLAIDVFSRMVMGFYISFDPPSIMSVGLCLSHAILPKESWLVKRSISTSWPCWGLMQTIHLDNAMEFRSNALKRACLEYGINIDWRPVATPNYGGHIERLLGTFSQEIHSLPGTTFSNPEQRGEYKSESRAAMTLSEFEIWLATFITGVYHQKLHSALNTSPIKKYERGIFGSSENPGSGLPARIVDEDRLRLDFMPYVERTVQEYGVVVDEIYYYSDVLRRFIHAPSSFNKKLKQAFLFKRDPRDISVIYFYDPEVKQYYPIPYRDTSRPAISLWELKEATRRLKEQGQKEINESLIFESYQRMREQEEKAVRETASIRRKKQRRALHQQIDKPQLIPNSDMSQVIDVAKKPLVITPFEEMEEL